MNNINNLPVMKKLSNFTGSETAICIGVQADFVRENGQATEVVKGYKYQIIVPEYGYTRFNIKTEESKPAFTNDDVRTAGGEVSIEVEKFEGRLFAINNKLIFSPVAESVRIVE